MKKFFGIIILTLGIPSMMFAQDQKETKSEKHEVMKPSRDFFMLQITYDNWASTPNNVKIGGIGRGFGAYLAYDFPFSKSNFSFAAGIGVTTNNIYFDNQIPIMNAATDSIIFQNVDTGMVSPDQRENFYKKSKLNTTYLEVPFELRFFGNKLNRNKGFKASIGMKVGLLVGASSKVNHSLVGPVIIEKVNTQRFVESWRFTPNVRVGWGNFSLYGSYNLSPLFKKGMGPEVFPYSIGICITGL